MLKILMIPNTERFLEKVNSCNGDVVLHLPDESTCSLKTFMVMNFEVSASAKANVSVGPFKSSCNHL